MKPFFIFATLLITLAANAGNLCDDPPVVHPSVDHIVLTPRNMMDKDRSIAVCGYWYDCDADCIEFSCHDTGNETVLYLLDQNGQQVDRFMLDDDMTSYAILHVPATAGTYRIVLISEKYYGEASIQI